MFADTGGYWDLLCINSVANQALAEAGVALAGMALAGMLLAVNLMELRWMLIDTGGGWD